MTPAESGGNAPSAAQLESTPSWVWFVFVAVAGLLIFGWWAGQRSHEVRSRALQELDMGVSLKLSNALERREIRKEYSVSGEVRGVTKKPAAVSLVNGASPIGVYRAMLARDAKIYRLSNDAVPKEIPLTLDDISIGSFVTVVSSEEIGRRETIGVTKVIKLR